MSLIPPISTFYWFISNALLLGIFVSSDAHECPCVCVVFNQHSDYIETKLYPDRDYTGFTITKKGYETEEKRREAVSEYYSNRRDIYPSFFVHYTSHESGKKVQKMDMLGCREVVTFDQFRAWGLFFKGINLVKEYENGGYKIWRAQLWIEECR